MLELPDEEPSLDEVWSNFCIAVPSDEVAADLIFDAMQAHGLAVCKCGSTDVSHKHGERIFKCSRCHTRTWLTAKTIMKHSERLRAWLAAICFKQHQILIGSPKLSKLLEMSQSGAYEIQCKLNRVILANMGPDCERVPTDLLSNSICKRSSETPARCHPSTEQSETIEEEDEFSIELFQLSAQTRALITMATQFICLHFHGVSRKYLQTYLANFGFWLDRPKADSNWFLKLCLGHPPISRDELMSFISPSILEIRRRPC